MLEAALGPLSAPAGRRGTRPAHLGPAPRRRPAHPGPPRGGRRGRGRQDQQDHPAAHHGLRRPQGRARGRDHGGSRRRHPPPPETVRRLCCDGLSSPSSSAAPARCSTGGSSDGSSPRPRPDGCGCATAVHLPGRDAPPQWTDGHHLLHWADHGPSDLGNAALLCERHHTVVHTRRYAGRVVRDRQRNGWSGTWPAAPTTTSSPDGARATPRPNRRDPAPHPASAGGVSACPTLRQCACCRCACCRCACRRRACRRCACRRCACGRRACPGCSRRPLTRVPISDAVPVAGRAPHDRPAARTLFVCAEAPVALDLGHAVDGGEVDVRAHGPSDSSSRWSRNRTGMPRGQASRTNSSSGSGSSTAHPVSCDQKATSAAYPLDGTSRQTWTIRLSAPAPGRAAGAPRPPSEAEDEAARRPADDDVAEVTTTPAPSRTARSAASAVAPRRRGRGGCRPRRRPAAP